VLTAILLGEPGLAGTRMSLFWILLELRTTEVVVTTAAIRRAKLQLNRHHQQTNTQFFRGRIPFLSPNQQRQNNKGKTLFYYLTQKLLYPVYVELVIISLYGSTIKAVNHIKFLTNAANGLIRTAALPARGQYSPPRK